MSREDLGTSTALPVASGRETWREIRDLSVEHRRRLAGVAVLGVLSAAVGLVVPAAIGDLVDGVQARTATAGTVGVALAVMVGAAVVGAAGTAVTIVLASRSYQAMLARLRERLVARAMALPQGTVERAGAGDLVSRASDDVAVVADAAPRVIPVLSTVVFTIIVTFAGMAALDWWYAVALAVVLPVYVVTMRWYLAVAPRVYADERTAMSGRAQQVVESQRGFATVLGFDLAERRHRRVLDASWAVAPHTLRARTVQNIFAGRLHLAEYLGLAAILVTGFLLIGAGLSTIGAATTAMLLFLRLFGPIFQLLFVIDVLQSVLASLNRMVGVIRTPEPVADPPPPAGRDGGSGEDGSVRLDGVAFAYDEGSLVLDGVALTVGARERVAVVGASGAGKTTLAAVVAGIHEPHEGSVTRPSRTAVITQETHVFVGTLRENLTLAAPDADDEAVLTALRATGAAGLLDVVPEGLDTELGPRGSSLTAAQGQQLALARVVLADPDLAIFDEATAEAGSLQADVLDRAADAALAGRTALVIAHRLSQATTCDRVVVMDRGRIIEEGTHAALVAADGVYARLWAAWSATAVTVSARDDGGAAVDPA